MPGLPGLSLTWTRLSPATGVAASLYPVQAAGLRVTQDKGPLSTCHFHLPSKTGVQCIFYNLSHVLKGRKSERVALQWCDWLPSSQGCQYMRILHNIFHLELSPVWGRALEEVEEEVREKVEEEAKVNVE